MKPLRMGLFVAVLAFPSSAFASLITNDPSLPPAGQYVTPADAHADYALGGGNIVRLTNIAHFGFTNIVRTDITTTDELEQFDSIVTGDRLLNGVPQGPISLSGPVVTRVFNKVGITTGTFATEMLALNLSDGGMIRIRESPTLASTGQTTIADIGGGLFRITSFFDVFTELSLDSGATFIPSANGPTHVDLVPVPEPASLVLMALGLAAALGARGARVRPTRRT